MRVKQVIEYKTCKVKFAFLNRKYSTSVHMRMIRG